MTGSLQTEERISTISMIRSIVVVECFPSLQTGERNATEDYYNDTAPDKDKFPFPSNGRAQRNSCR